MISTPGITGLCGKWPGKKGSFAEVDGAGCADFEPVDGGVVLDGQVLGSAVAAGGGPDLGWGSPAEGAVAAVVVVLAIVGEQGLEFGQGGWLGGVVGEPAFECLVVAFDFAAGLRVVGAGMDQACAPAGDGAGEL